MFETSLVLNDFLFLAKGAAMTLAVTLVSVAAGTLLGVIFGTARTLLTAWTAAPLTFVLDILRSVPLLIQLVLANAFQSIAGLQWSPFTVACVVLSLYTSSYCAEIVRGGIEAVPSATRRAARSLGMNWWQDLSQIVFPMALRVALPSWIGLALGVMKDSALVMWIGIIELLRSSQILVTRLQEPLLILIIVGAIYFMMSFPIARFGARLEQRWREND